MGFETLASFANVSTFFDAPWLLKDGTVNVK